MPTYEEVFSVTKEVILDLKDYEDEDIRDDMTFSELDLDSLDFIELQVVMKKKFKAIMKPDVFESGEVSTLRQMCDYVTSLSSHAA